MASAEMDMAGDGAGEIGDGAEIVRLRAEARDITPSIQGLRYYSRVPRRTSRCRNGAMAHEKTPATGSGRRSRWES